MTINGILHDNYDNTDYVDVSGYCTKPEDNINGYKI